MELTRSHQLEMAKHGLLRLYGTVLIDTRLAGVEEVEAEPNNVQRGTVTATQTEETQMNSNCVDAEDVPIDSESDENAENDNQDSEPDSESPQAFGYRITIMDLAPPDSYSLSEVIATGYHYAEHVIESQA